MQEWHCVDVDESVFSLDVVTKATYWLSGRYTVDLLRDRSRERIVVRLALPGGTLSDEQKSDVEVRLRRDLIDFRTRAIIEQETRVIRDLLVAKAFAAGDEANA